MCKQGKLNQFCGCGCAMCAHGIAKRAIWHVGRGLYGVLTNTIGYYTGIGQAGFMVCSNNLSGGYYGYRLLATRRGLIQLQ